MVKVTFVEAGGKETAVNCVVGRSLMENAVQNGVPVIIADCGGTCSCGTCRVYIDAPWSQYTGGVSEIEDAMLDMVEDNDQAKRLSCQVTVVPELDGMIVRLPESQL